MVEQKDASLDSFLDESAPPTLVFTKLTPELSNAALNLSIDFFRNIQTTASRAIVFHPFSIISILLSSSAYSYYILGDYYKVGGIKLIWENLEIVVTVLIFITGVSSFFFVLATFFTTVIRDRADNIVKDSEVVFGLDLTRLAVINPKSSKLDKSSIELLEKAENTQIALYRETPIALISIEKSDELSNKQKFVTKIKGLGIRKVYSKSGILEDLIDWSIYRTNILNNNKAGKILILLEVLSTDNQLKKTLQKKKFQKITNKSIETDSISNIGLKLYGISVEIWGVALNVKNKDQISNHENIKELINSNDFSKKIQ
ncbi:hypothetical protein WICMUC_002641 [Wickerhamomyces mucosus]|uniref:Uncharacterized protein n=1 Tax=Wickerhamomyces mucosus TaxID=1378264 RepID=A0A9P8PQ22_9ASCO|nr:hypothetical protein WICMUC_002641 [Wickerhamomyces mucosus]